MNRKLRAVALFTLLLGLARSGPAGEPAAEPGPARPVKIGAVAYAPSAVTIFRDLTRYLNKNGFPSDFVLYSGYDALVEALERGDVDIAWNTPLAHGQYHVKNQCASRTLVMRDVDFNVRSTLIVRVDSGIQSLADLKDKRLVLGSWQSAESTVLPLHYLKGKGVDFNAVKFVNLDEDIDSQGNPCASPEHVLQALLARRGEAGIITADLWHQVRKQPDTKAVFREVWTSPPFSHCVFTASPEFNGQLAEQFTQLMTAMDPQNPECAEVMRLEGTKRWLPGSPDGFKDLVQALQTEQP